VRNDRLMQETTALRDWIGAFEFFFLHVERSLQQYRSLFG